MHNDFPQLGFGQAQETKDPRDRGFFSIGVHHVNIGDLNRQLEAAGYPAFGRTMFAIGGGGHAVQDGGLMLGGEGYGGRKPFPTRSTTYSMTPTVRWQCIKGGFF